MKALDKNTVLMVLKEDESWAPISQASVSQNMEEKKGRSFRIRLRKYLIV